MVGDDVHLNEITKIMLKYKSSLLFKKFNSESEMRTYVSSVEYGAIPDKDKFCLGFTFKKDNDNYDFSLSYSDGLGTNAHRTIPNNLRKSLDFFETTPLFDEFREYNSAGYTQMMRIINE
jgi:hypothetical protein